ncbi:hypothetical protein CspeluHIS016_0406030 [Cutaneotrichosporon spelunceum]|uniref:Uncharacterized protein n=1 Tax=Cutaneotrichosporon spelunceum TaxID=1672016 RepID=A0AAD3TWI9_9TREE|nr:hypothetical protein CspeluHIS016_0406030 [Cutaneotrichosporon spelunceum]
MARPYSPSYNSYYVPPKPSAPTPRLSSHPFFVDQTPYLSSRRLSNMSLQSTASSYRSPSASGSSSTTSPSASAVSLNWPFRKTPHSPPTETGRPRGHSRAASTGHEVTSSPASTTLTPKAASLHTATAPIDRRCLQWMREAERHEHEWILGSVASRSAGRGRVFFPSSNEHAEPTEEVEVLHEPRSNTCDVVKRRFRLVST